MLQGSSQTYIPKERIIDFKIYNMHDKGKKRIFCPEDYATKTKNIHSYGYYFVEDSPLKRVGSKMVSTKKEISPKI